MNHAQASSRDRNRMQREKDMLLAMARKDFRARYAGSRLGGIWGLATPVLLAAAIGFVFSRIFVLPVTHPVVFVLAGFFPWLFLSESLSRSMRVLQENRRVFDQFDMPPKMPLMAAVLGNGTCFLVNLAVLVALACTLGGGFGWNLLWLPFVGMCWLFFVTGLSLLLCMINVFLRDVRYVVDIFLMLWFWATPVFYSPAMVPERFARLAALNPAAVFVSGFRAALGQGEGIGFGTGLIIFALAALTYAFGFALFSAVEKRLVKWL